VAAAVLVVVACIACNAALAALEIAFVSASKADIRARADAGDVRVWRFLRLRETPERTLSAIQVGITLVSLLSGAVGGASAHEFVSPFLQQWLGLGEGSATMLAIAIVALPLMFVTIVVGELVPKALALRHPEQIALAGARGLRVLERMFLPIVGVLAWTTKTLVVRILRAPSAGVGKGQPQSLDSTMHSTWSILRSDACAMPWFHGHRRSRRMPPSRRSRWRISRLHPATRDCRFSAAEK
jgi:CBS domain containing-hemolysin-like protein